MVVLAFLKLLGCLGLLMYGTRLMGESLQQLAGDRLRHILDSLTTNRFTSLLTGALVTAMIQSSTAASLMTVSFVHAGMLTLVQALPILMGASVGNTFIAWIMAAEFNFSISNYIYPLILVAFIMTYYRKWNALGNSIFGLCFILLSLGLLCHMADDMTLTGPDGIARYLAVSHENYGSYAILLFIGAAVTFGVQSSAVLMATSMALCSTGVWSIYSGVAFVLGENIGRAIVTCRAASSAGTPARRTALGQLVFNLSGVTWMFLAFPYFVNLLCDFIHFDPTQKLMTADKNLAYVWQPFIPVSIFATPPCLSVWSTLSNNWLPAGWPNHGTTTKRKASCVSLPKGYSTLRNSPSWKPVRKSSTMPTPSQKCSHKPVSYSPYPMKQNLKIFSP